MKIIYSGFDTIIFAIKGAAKPSLIMQLQIYKQSAKEKQTDVAVNFDDGALRGLIAPTGMKGGYAYIIKLGGELGHVISLKKNLNRQLWNVHVKIRALALACYGWEGAVKRALSDLKRLGVSNHEISLNRVDYAMDYLNAGILLKPADFVAHARVKKTAHKIDLNSYSRGQICESVTLGKMPNRQIIVYDKRREVTEKRKPAWFEIWGINPTDITLTVHRVEVRLGKDQLSNSDIKTFDDFKARINVLMTRAVHVVRYVRPNDDQNVSRWPNHPLWNHVQAHVKEHVLKNPNCVDIPRVKHVIRSQKAIESQKQIIGNMAGYSVFMDMEADDMKADMVKFIDNQFSRIEADDTHPFWKSRARTQDKFEFL